MSMFTTGARVRWRVCRTDDPDNDLTGVGTIDALPVGRSDVYAIQCDDGEARQVAVWCLQLLCEPEGP